MTVTDVVPPEAQPSSTSPGVNLGRWKGVLVTEGEMTGDDRLFEPGSIQYDEAYLPFPLRWAPEDFGGHDGAVHVAWIEKLTRNGSQIMGEGPVFRQEFMDYLDTAGKAGVSVDCDNGTYTVELVEPTAPSIEGVDIPQPGVEYGVPRMIEHYQDARLRAATVVDIPAFISAFVEPESAGGMVASGFSGFIEPTGELRDDEAIEYALDGRVIDDIGTLADQVKVILATTDEAGVAAPEKTSADAVGITHSGLALQAQDTGRVLMVQRAIEATDEAAGKWEYPGGGIDPGEDPAVAAAREFGEEVGHPLSELAKDSHFHDFGIYRLHVLTVPTEADQPIDGRSTPNPDGHKEATAWWNPADIAGNPMVRQEVLDNHDQVKFPMEGDVTTAATNPVPPVPPKKAAVPTPPAPPKKVSPPSAPVDEAAIAKSLQDAIDALGDTEPDVVNHLTQALDALAKDDEPTADDHMTASAAPVAPPDEWFEPFDLDGPTPLTVTASGRVFGHVAAWESCHVGPQYAGKCVKPPSDPKAPFFQLGELITASGATLDVGGITVGGGHFTASGMITTLEHHDDATSVAAAVVVREDEFGIGVFGSVTPDATPNQIAALRRSPVSGAWRTEKGKRRLVGIHAVVNPGFPMPRQMVASVTPEEFITYGRIEPRQPDPSAIDLRSFVQRMAKSVNLDTDSLVASARQRMSSVDCGCDDSEGD